MGYNVAARSADECSSDQGSVPDGAIAVAVAVGVAIVGADVEWARWWPESRSWTGTETEEWTETETETP
jgi:hypothetical protein